MVLAAGVGLAVASNWRVAYLVGIVPALLVLWVRASVKEPETWQAAKSNHSDELGSFRALLGNPKWRLRAIFGALLSAVSMLLFWPVRRLFRMVFRRRPPGTPRFKRIVILGLDGLDHGLTEKLLAAGKLPHLASLRDDLWLARPGDIARHVLALPQGVVP